MLQTPTRTRFPRFVKPIAELQSVLGYGSNNRKTGNIVTKGRFKGYQIRTVTLEERATCPSSCHHWLDCYGNHMPWAYRADHADDQFLLRLADEIAAACAARPKSGVLVRLHILGDFYSVDYVRFWERQLALHDNLAVWGYTARDTSEEIGRALVTTYQRFEASRRFEIRWSRSHMVGAMGAVGIEHAENCPPGAFVCPEQTGKTKSCATCGACWSTLKTVAFVAH